MYPIGGLHTIQHTSTTISCSSKHIYIFLKRKTILLLLYITVWCMVSCYTSPSYEDKINNKRSGIKPDRLNGNINLVQRRIKDKTNIFECSFYTLLNLVQRQT